MKPISRLFSFALLAVILVSAMVAPALATKSKKSMASHHKVAATTWPQVCPVSGTKIASASDAANSDVYKGKTYYFCCPMCKPLFVKDPAKYLAAAAKGKYLDPM